MWDGGSRGGGRAAHSRIRSAADHTEGDTALSPGVGRRKSEGVPKSRRPKTPYLKVCRNGAEGMRGNYVSIPETVREKKSKRGKKEAGGGKH